MIGFYNYTVILTYLSLVSSALGIYFASGIGESGSHPEYAIVCLMLSGLFDMFDGKVARTRKRTDEEKNSEYKLTLFAIWFVLAFCRQLSDTLSA